MTGAAMLVLSEDAAGGVPELVKGVLLHINHELFVTQNARQGF